MNSLNLGFDAKRAFHNTTGLGVYSRVLLRHLSRDFPQHRYHLFSPSGGSPELGEALYQAPFIPHLFAGPRLMSGYWRSFRIGKQARSAHIDLYHGLSHELPVGLDKRGIRSVVSIHDLIFERFPDHYPWLDRLIYRQKIRYSCQHASRVVAISEASKQDLIDIYQVEPSRIEVVYQTCDEIFWESVEREKPFAPLPNLRLPSEYLLTVGAGKRKNLLSILKAMQMIQSPPLLVVGQAPPSRLILEMVSQKPLKDRVIFLRKIKTAQLPALYRNASLFVFPSLFEGFGIPVLEALVSGTPVITSRLSPLTEVGGPKTRYVDPLHPAELAQAMEELLHDSDRQEEMKQAGRSYAQLFAPHHLSRQWMRLYESVLE